MKKFLKILVGIGIAIGIIYYMAVLILVEGIH